MLKCRSCGEVFDELDAPSVTVYEDFGDVVCLSCPNCGRIEYEGSVRDPELGLGQFVYAGRGKRAAYATAPRVPAEVHGDDEDEQCPLCGSDNFDGDLCLICGYQEPPEGFGDIEMGDVGVDVESSFEKTMGDEPGDEPETGTGTRGTLGEQDVAYIENFVSNWLYEAGFTFSAYPDVLDDFIDEAADIIVENVDAIDCSVTDACELWLLGVERNYESAADVVVDRLNGEYMKTSGRKAAASEGLVDEMEGFGLYSDDGGKSYYAPVGDAFGALYLDKTDGGEWVAGVVGLDGDVEELESAEPHADPFEAIQDAASGALDDEGEYLEGFDGDELSDLWSLVESGGSEFYEEEVLREGGEFYGRDSDGAGGTRKGVTLDGEPCRNPVADGEEYCYLHEGRREMKETKGAVRKSARNLVDPDEVENYIYNCDFFGTGYDMPLSRDELRAVAEKAEEYLLGQLLDMDWFHSMFDSCIRDALCDVTGRYVQSSRKRAYEEVEFYWGAADIHVKGTPDGVEWSVDAGGEYEQGLSHGADEAAMDISDFLSSLPGYDDVTQGDILDEMDYYELEARRYATLRRGLAR